LNSWSSLGSDGWELVATMIYM